MCGRFTLAASAAELATLFDLEDAPALPPRYNIAPSQPVVVARLDAAGRRHLALMRWGLIPAWIKEITAGAALINARSETAAEKPSFRAAFKRRRCLIPATGFFEWQKRGDRKQPYLIARQDGRPFAMAGLWEFWQGGDGSELTSCTILTTTANAVVQPLHERMPVLIDPQDFADWLDPATPADLLHHLLRSAPAAGMHAFPVSAVVNNPANDTPACLQPLTP